MLSVLVIVLCGWVLVAALCAVLVGKSVHSGQRQDEPAVARRRGVAASIVVGDDAYVQPSLFESDDARNSFLAA